MTGAMARPKPLRMGPVVGGPSLRERKVQVTSCAGLLRVEAEGHQHRRLPLMLTMTMMTALRMTRRP